MKLQNGSVLYKRIYSLNIKLRWGQIVNKTTLCERPNYLDDIKCSGWEEGGGTTIPLKKVGVGWSYVFT